MIIVSILAATPCSAQTATVPSVYQDLYTQLNGDVTDFQGKVTQLWNGSRYPVKFSGQLTSANSNNGPGLLQPSSFTLTQTEIAYLKSLGVKAISVEVSFPMLYQPFFDSIGQSQYQSQFAAFYANVAAAIRAQGLQVIVESQSMIPTGLQSVWGSGLQKFYSGVTAFQDYENARALTAGTVASTMRPDYFVLQEEPDTEAHQSGQAEAGTVAGSTTMLNGSVAAARNAGVPGMQVGAGFGSWLQSFQLFANSFTQQQCGQTVRGPGGPVSQPCVSASLDFLDLHLYPITEHTTYCTPPPSPQPCASPNFLANALAIVSTANAGKKPIAISQTWLRKTSDSEWLQISGDIDEAREAYSFWAPLDAAFLQAVYSLANYAHMPFVVPFNTQNFAAYLTWSGGGTCTIPACTAIQGEGGGNTPAQVFSAVQSAALNAIQTSAYSSVGNSYRNLIQPFSVSLATANQVEPFAPEAIVSAYGTNLAAVTATATPPLSTSLAGTTVTVMDSAGVSRAAFVFYVSSSQVNYEIPQDTAAGLATVTIASQSSGSQSAVIPIGVVSPGVFQLNAAGLVAAWVLPVISGVSQPLLPVYQLDASNNVVPLPVNLGPPTEQIYLELYGTGIRNAKSVTVTVGTMNVPVLFAGPAPGYSGLDQVNVGPLPRTLAGQGSVNIVVTADDQVSNTVNLTIQ
ncbi:MAG TPA: hypothetical protein VEU96_03315 [Bryobacteraceae bacterium]|nr:hypothetical protein [Bryobacteraceae bacterium]